MTMSGRPLEYTYEDIIGGERSIALNPGQSDPQDEKVVSKQLQLTPRQMTRISRALADPHRYEILKKIAEKQRCACQEIRGRLPISAATISHHIKELETAGLIAIEREGRFAWLSFQRELWQAYLGQLGKV
jgi:ArsR family transcriptional regulator